MAHFNGLYLVFASIGLLLCNVAQSQISSTTTVAPGSSTTASGNTTVAVPSGPFSCEEATPATINGTLFLGTWFEAARQPIGGGTNTEECVQLIVARDAGTVTVKITYSVDPNNLWINQTTTNNILFNSQTSGSEVFEGVFNVNTAGVNTTYKILQTDYSSYALVCGYTPLNVTSASTSTTVTTPAGSSTTSAVSTSAPSSTTSANSTVAPSTTPEPVNAAPSGAFILTRERQINATQLASLSAGAVANFTDFSNIATVTQSSQCYDNGVSTTVPALAMIMAVVYSLLKFVH